MSYHKYDCAKLKVVGGGSRISQRGTTTPKGGALAYCFVAKKNCMKMKEFGLRGEIYLQIMIGIFTSLSFVNVFTHVCMSMGRGSAFLQWHGAGRYPLYRQTPPPQKTDPPPPPAGGTHPTGILTCYGEVLSHVSKESQTFCMKSLYCILCFIFKIAFAGSGILSSVNLINETIVLGDSAVVSTHLRGSSLLLT